MKEDRNLPPFTPSTKGYTLGIFQLRRGPNGLLPPTHPPRPLQPLSALNPTHNLSEEEKISTLEEFIHTAINAQRDAIRFLNDPENVEALFQRREDALYAIEQINALYDEENHGANIPVFLLEQKVLPKFGISYDSGSASTETNSSDTDDEDIFGPPSKRARPTR